MSERGEQVLSGLESFNFNSTQNATLHDEYGKQMYFNINTTLSIDHVYTIYEEIEKSVSFIHTKTNAKMMRMHFHLNGRVWNCAGFSE